MGLWLLVPYAYSCVQAIDAFSLFIHSFIRLSRRPLERTFDDINQSTTKSINSELSEFNASVW